MTKYDAILGGSMTFDEKLRALELKIESLGSLLVGNEGIGSREVSHPISGKFRSAFELYNELKDSIRHLAVNDPVRAKVLEAGGRLSLLLDKWEAEPDS